jgi:hypothetical protein
MSDLNKNLSDVFDMIPIEEEKKTNLPLVVKKEGSLNSMNLESDLTDAYQQTKDNLQDLIDQGKEAMEEILEIAKQGQHPRAFEVYGTLLKNVVDANKELLAVQKQMREMDSKKKDSGTTIDKAIFVGSTQELNKLLKGKSD